MTQSNQKKKGFVRIMNRNIITITLRRLPKNTVIQKHIVTE